MLRHELTSKTYPLKARLKLFNGTITPTILYGCTAWTTTQDMITTLQRTQRRMLRMILGTPRRRLQHAGTQPPNDHSSDDINSNTSQSPPLDHLITLPDEEALEPWPDFIKRATRQAEAMTTKMIMEECAVTFWRRKWRWARRVATQARQRWSRLASTWDPEIADRRPTGRKQGRQRKRWDDDITMFLNTHTDDLPPDCPPDWLQVAQRGTLWQHLEESFVKYVT